MISEHIYSVSLSLLESFRGPLRVLARAAYKSFDGRSLIRDNGLVFVVQIVADGPRVRPRASGRDGIELLLRDGEQFAEVDADVAHAVRLPVPVGGMRGLDVVKHVVLPEHGPQLRGGVLRAQRAGHRHVRARHHGGEAARLVQREGVRVRAVRRRRGVLGRGRARFDQVHVAAGASAEAARVAGVDLSTD